MSEYQYYDLKAIDRALTKTEMTALRSISTRAVITSTSFTNHYEWGDLKADPLKLLATYFDVLLALCQNERNEGSGIVEDEFVHQLVRALANAENVQEPEIGRAHV